MNLHKVTAVWLKVRHPMFLQEKLVNERQEGTVIWSSEFGTQSQVTLGSNPIFPSSFIVLEASPL